MAPTKALNPKSVLVKNLTALPTELVFKILDDLPIYATLKLACSEDERINACILKHAKYTTLFSSGETLADIKRYFKLYDQVYTVVALQKLEENSILALDVSLYSRRRFLLPGWSGNYSDTSPDISFIRNYLHDKIWKVLQTADDHLTLLNGFIQDPKKRLQRVWDFSAIDNLEQRWHSIRDSETTLNSIKSAQITRFANLLETYPRHFLTSTDMEQEFRKPGHPKAQHLVFSYRVEARKMLHPQVFGKGSKGRGLRSARLFAPSNLPIIPTRYSLNIVLAGLEQYPCATAEDLRRDGKMKDAKGGDKHHAYPSSVEDDIRTALTGLTYVYANPQAPRTPGEFPEVAFRRTDNTPYSLPSEGCCCKPTSISTACRKRPYSAEKQSKRQKWVEQKEMMIKTVEGQPHFCIPARLPKRPLKGYNGTLNTGWPHDERELEWLEAYLRVVRYMSEELGVKA